MTGEFAVQRASNAENVSIDDVIMIHAGESELISRHLFSYFCYGCSPLHWSLEKFLKMFHKNFKFPIRSPNTFALSCVIMTF